MAARAAEEDATEGKKNITPYWRTIKSKGELNEKYPGGLDGHAKHLEAEGHTIEPDRAEKPKRVQDWESKVVSI